MVRALPRSALVAFAVLVPSAAAGEGPTPPPLTATMQCERAIEPGRVRCSIEAHAAEGRSLQWADVVLVALPDFAAALKGRIGREDSVARDATSAKWAFGIVAKRSGNGEARARVRAVTCEGFGGTRCAPVVVEVHTQVSVGG